MESRKRSRFEMIDINNLDSNEDMQGVALPTTGLGSATIATIGGQSFLLSNSTVSPLPANILLSLCDENSNGSEEYILDHSLLPSVKHEHTGQTQVANNSQIHLQQSNVVTASPQFRIINQSGKPLNTAALSSAIINNNNSVVNSNNSLVSNSLNFPPGCEIYVVKEVFNTPKQIIAKSTTSTNTSPETQSGAGAGATIKVETMSPLPVQRHCTLNDNKISNRKANAPLRIKPISSPVTSISHTSLSTTLDETARPSSILEAYKNRDDKRRAIHNEVERRRRDKINSWIFKLKEMLPSEEQGNSTSTRTPANDSKSQILIKACEYIKSMQEEMTSLRECLTENENLRSKNQRLQNEINSLRSKQQQQQKLNNNRNVLLTTNTTINNNDNNDSNHNSDSSDNCEITLNSLNTSYENVQLFTTSTNQRNHHNLSDIVGLRTNSNAGISTPTSINVTYGKELIITDYVD